MRPQLRLIGLQELLEQQAQTDNPLRMGVDRGQAMAVADVEGPEGIVQIHRRVVQIAEGGGEHADAVEGHHARGRTLVRLALHRKRLVLHAAADIRVPREAEQHLVEHVLEHKVLVVVGGRQLDVLEDQLVHNVIGGPDSIAQLLPVINVLREVIIINGLSFYVYLLYYIVVQLAIQDGGPKRPSIGSWGATFL